MSTPTPPSPTNSFFTPSYLRASGYIQRLRLLHEQRLLDLQQEAHSAGKSGASLSSNSHGSGGHSRESSHTAALQDVVVERHPPPPPSTADALPSTWSPTDKQSGLDILADGTEVRFNGVTKATDDAASVRSDFPMPKECGIYYFEVTILSRGKDVQIGIGFSSKKASLNRLPGWETESWAYHGDDGHVFACQATGKMYGPKFASMDVVGCGVNFRTGKAFFTKNGVFQGTAFSNVKTDSVRIYPSVGMKKAGDHIRINFGKTPFVFDIDGMVDKERQAILEEIRKADVSELHPPDNENGLIHKLIGQYLAHEGYVETAKAFTRDIREREASLTTFAQAPTTSEEDVVQIEDDVHAVNRQRIRRAILDGDIDRAMKYTQSYYPRLFDDERNRDVYFRLRCRKFIEMYRRAADAGPHSSSKPTVSAVEDEEAEDDEEEDEEEEDPSTQMDLDTQLRSPDRDNDFAMSDPPLQRPRPEKSHRALESAALRYGAELNEEFAHDPRPEIQTMLRDCFAVVAYGHWKTSPVQYLFEESGREGLAEGVNGAVLVSLGKMSSAALERVCAQTEALLDEVSGKNGGGASFVSVRGDFLRG